MSPKEFSEIGSGSDLLGKAGVVTGAAQGIGRVIALSVVRYGVLIVIADLDAELAQATAGALSATGPRAVAKRCDVTNEQDVAAVAQACVDEFGRMDYWVDNAGVTRGLAPRGRPALAYHREAKTRERHDEITR